MTFVAKRPRLDILSASGTVDAWRPGQTNIVLRWRMYGDLVPLIPNTFEIPEPTRARRWFAALVMTAIVIGATLALVIVSEMPASAASAGFL
jgi:hypothetical protein